MKSLYFTVVSRSCLHMARVLMRSIAAAMPEAGRYVLVVDPPETYFQPQNEPFDLTFGADLDLPDFLSLAFRNDIGAFCCLLKPAFALHLLKQTAAERLFYVDADMRCYRPTNDLDGILEKTPVLLSPHALAPIPPGSWRTDGDIMRAGAFNAGFFAVRRSEEAAVFLKWWLNNMRAEPRLSRIFTYDQMWLNLAPSYFPSAGIIRHPGYNVAYWNLHERPITRSPQGILLAAGEPLTFFHYSYFSHTTPALLVNRPPMHFTAEPAEVASLARTYAQEMTEARADECLRWPYGYGRFTDGKRVSEAHRDYYALRVLPASGTSGNPFDPKFEAGDFRGLKSLYSSDRSVVHFARRINRLLRRGP